MSLIIKMYWKCPYCGKQEIDGLVDKCPGCGARKPEDIKYYLLEKEEVVTKEELCEAGISIEECDGNHKEWICNNEKPVV